MELPKRYDPKESEKKWQKFWIENSIFTFDPDSKKEIFSIDTPPPTVSGKMHLGHAFSYSQQDFIARYKRMRNFNVFYPFGTDDNGLATERLIEKMKKVKGTKMPRDEFTKLCLNTLKNELRPQYIQDWKDIGMSCDWNIFYTTIDEHSQKTSQKAFLDLIKKDRAYRKFAPVMFCPQCQTAIAQVELEDLERDGTLNHIQVETDKGEKLVFATTRPELMMACIAISVHPDDERYKHVIGQTVKIPATDLVVPVIADDFTKMDFGTGVVYWCPFGDINDIEFVAKHPDLEVRHIMGSDGRLNEHAGKYQGMNSLEAREAVLQDWKECGALIKQENTKQVVNVHERCQTPIEFIALNQWFVRYLDLKDDFLKRGDELNWYPNHMKNRYDNWIKGLKWDWNISRQRFSGVPFPVWYDKETKEPIYANEEQLPVDPLKDLPQGYTKEQVEPETDVMDTWATSSLTPHITADLFKDHPVYEKLLPMSLRPQAHDIITFWLFNTVVRSHIHDEQLPWLETMISGWALDPHGKKMSKSKGNVVEPQKMIEKYSADALRFWAAGSKLGDDLPFQDKDLLTGQKFTTKLWNASKFALMHLKDYEHTKPEVLEPVDKWLLSKLSRIIQVCTENFDRYEYSKTKLEVESFFWHDFCDYYLEIAKDRLYNPDKRSVEAKHSAQYTLYETLLAVLKMMAPIMPFITEELYQFYYAKEEGKKSVHISPWPEFALVDEQAEKIGQVVIDTVEHARRAKSEKSVSLKTPLKQLFIKAKITPEEFGTIIDEIRASTHAEEIEYEQLDEKSEANFGCELEL